MSIHPSLKVSSAGRKHRSVLKRFERLSILKEKGLLKEEDSVFGMPKLKIIKVKIKKEKAAEKPAEAGAATPAPAEAAPKKEAAPKAGKEEKKK
jgi:small basic protein (TIGR04137 family)